MILTLRNSRIKLSHGQIFWREIGQGRAIVFLHGAWTDSGEWLPIIQPLGEQFHCFAPDLLGFGDSEQPNSHYSIQLEVECLAEYFDALKIRQVCLVGHGLGAWVAVSYAISHPDHVDGLVLIAPEGVQPDDYPNPWQMGRWLIARPPLLVWALQLVYPLMRLLGLGDEIQKLLTLRRQLRRSPVATELLCQRRWTEIRAELVEERLPWLKLPTLVMVSPSDQPSQLAMAQTYAQLLPNGKLECPDSPDPALLATMPTAIAEQISRFMQHL